MSATRNTLETRTDRTEFLPGYTDSFLAARKARFLRIDSVHQMPDFLINLVSPDNQWIFITSRGALTAGRKNANHSLFPYYTHDKLIDLTETTGCFTSFWVGDPETENLHNWRPFSKDPSYYSQIERTLYKSPESNEIIFEEINKPLGLSFAYLWTFSPAYGFARLAELKNTGNKPRSIRMLDGLQNLVPYGLNQHFMNRFSNLSDAYKKSERVTPENLGIFYLSSIPTDRAEPSEGLRSTLAWSMGYHPEHTLLSNRQLENFQSGQSIHSEQDVRGQRCCYLLGKDLLLEQGASFQGWLVADINQDAGAIESLLEQLKEPSQLISSLLDDIERGKSSIQKKLTAADGYQVTDDNQRCSRHLSNVQFNIMRGGIFINHYQVPTHDFILHLNNFNKPLYSKFSDFLSRLPSDVHFKELNTLIEQKNDNDLLRLTKEYLPLTFSRRHGDPSRPWNEFSIDTTDGGGNPILAYQGNWRDIFQNWEALAFSFPEFLEGMIFRFLNASTADGYNPYRLTKDGFYWEVPDPHEPWSNIGYWGDHQIIYLLKLLEQSHDKEPSSLASLLDKPLFVYANVPYRIADFETIWNNPRNTVLFDEEAQSSIEERFQQLGSDGKLLASPEGHVVKVSLLEKILNPLLSKLSNFVPEGGIWLNTQRPEWNDANNALVGYGLSVVTLGYLHCYLDFLLHFLDNDSLPEKFSISEPVLLFYKTIQSVLSKESDKLSNPMPDDIRYRVTQALGEAGSDFRREIYGAPNWNQSGDIERNDLLHFVSLTKSWIQHSLRANKRKDGLFHSYNLMIPGRQALGIDHLYEMLEGQVSILSSRFLSTPEAADLLNSLRKSRLFLEDRQSYLLYPDRDLPRFLEKGILKKEHLEQSSVLNHLLKEKVTRIVYQDIHGNVRFSGDLRNAEDLRDALDALDESHLSDFSNNDKRQTIRIFEDVFQHRSFTGRSGTFFAYEGLGSIYWHMVSKLLLAIQETYLKAAAQSSSNGTLASLSQHYFETLCGLGIYQTPSEYGAFPSDPYSHTPKHAGAQQPGMTGQVKEDILVRWGELGVQVKNGQLSFRPQLLRKSEFLTNPKTLQLNSTGGQQRDLRINENELAFTFCQVPIIYSIDAKSEVIVQFNDGTSHSQASPELSKELSQSLFSREGNIRLITVRLVEANLQ